MIYVVYDTDGVIKFHTNNKEIVDLTLVDMTDYSYITVDDSTKIDVTTQKVANEAVVTDSTMAADQMLITRRGEREIKFSQTIDKMNPLWYNELTATQQTELATWRTAWLDYPSTGNKPDDLDIFD